MDLSDKTQKAFNACSEDVHSSQIEPLLDYIAELERSLSEAVKQRDEARQMVTVAYDVQWIERLQSQAAYAGELTAFAAKHRNLLASIVKYTDRDGDMADAAVHGLAQSYLAISMTEAAWREFNKRLDCADLGFWTAPEVAALSKNTSTPNPAGVTPYRSDAESGKQTDEGVKGPAVLGVGNADGRIYCQCEVGHNYTVVNPKGRDGWLCPICRREPVQTAKPGDGWKPATSTPSQGNPNG